MRSRSACWVVCVLLAMGAAPSVQAEVRFGRNVRIGGHDVSGQTFNRQRRGEFHVHRQQPARPGCVWRANGDGSRTKVCHWKRRR
ncbi:MAG: hypothetical protein LCH39_13350 [Proteobacteria bacterium]|nr:hypothetical protein [Pseudomonadota bacterium]